MRFHTSLDTDFQPVARENRPQLVNYPSDEKWGEDLAASFKTSLQFLFRDKDVCDLGKLVVISSVGAEVIEEIRYFKVPFWARDVGDISGWLDDAYESLLISRDQTRLARGADDNWPLGILHEWLLPPVMARNWPRCEDRRITQYSHHVSAT